MANGTKGPRSIKLSPKDMEHIERVVYYEAKGEGVEGRNAVRAVILNRIASGKFGSNPLAVLNGKNQFEPVRKFGKGDARRLKVPPQVLNEYKDEHINFLKSGVDPTGGATFFLNQETAKNPYNTKSPGLKIGNHTFFNHYNDNPVTVPNYEVSLRGFKQDLTKLALTPKKPAPAPVQQTSLGKEEDLVPYQTKSEPTMWDRVNPWSDYNSSPNKASDELVPYTPKNLADGGLLDDIYEGDYLYTEPPEVQILKYSDVLNENSDKTFVDRILNPQKYPTPDEQTDEEGNKFYETHRMAYSEGKDGKFYVYPTVFLNEDGSYQKADDPDEAFNRAMDSGDYIEFDDEEAAKDFSINYKPDSFKNFYKENMMKKGYAHGGMAGCGMMAPDETVGYDEVSGNPIPPGSSPENVRDDIPAMLSEGEFVVPADVVKWHGLKTFMDMRAEAKMGLMAMQMEGQLHSPMMDDEYEDQEETEEEPDSEDAVEPDVSAEEDSAEEGDEELSEGEHETPEGNVVTIVEPEIEEETMDVEEEEDEYASEYVGDQELIFIIKGDPSAFRLA